MSNTNDSELCLYIEDLRILTNLWIEQLSIFIDREFQTKIQQIVLDKENDPDWAKDYQRFLDRFKEVKGENANYYIHEERAFIIEILEILIEEFKEFVRLSLRNGINRRYEDILKILAKYSRIYDLRKYGNPIYHVD